MREGTWSTTFDVFDSFGRAHQPAGQLHPRAGQPNRWQAEVAVDPDAAGGRPTPAVEVGQAGAADNLFFLDFDNLGALQSVLDAPGQRADAEGDLQVQVAFDVPEADIPRRAGGLRGRPST